MSIGHSNVHLSIGQTEMSIGHPNVHSSIGRMDEWTLSNGKHSSLLSTWGQTQSNYVITASLALKTLHAHWTYINVHSSIGRAEMSIGHSNVHLSIGQTEMSIGHSNVHSSIGRTEMSIGHPNVIRPLDEWTNGHCLMASTLVSYPHGVRLSQITSLQLPWHCKRYMSIGHI